MRNKENWARALRADEFELLCLDGTRMPVEQYKKCNLGQVKGRAMVTARKEVVVVGGEGRRRRGVDGRRNIDGHGGTDRRTTSENETSNSEQYFH